MALLRRTSVAARGHCVDKHWPHDQLRLLSLVWLAGQLPPEAELLRSRSGGLRGHPQGLLPRPSPWQTPHMQLSPAQP